MAGPGVAWRGMAGLGKARQGSGAAETPLTLKLKTELQLADC